MIVQKGNIISLGNGFQHIIMMLINSCVHGRNHKDQPNVVCVTEVNELLDIFQFNTIHFLWRIAMLQ